jgi:hypothetical protein
MMGVEPTTEATGAAMATMATVVTMERGTCLAQNRVVPLVIWVHVDLKILSPLLRRL